LADRCLKGHVAVSVIARTGGPIVVPLVDAEGKTFSGGGVALRVTGVSRGEEKTVITVTIRGEQAEPYLPPRPAIPLGDYRPPYRVEDHVEVQDDRGRALWWNAGPLQRGEGAGLETQLTVHRGRTGPPARIVYHGVVGVATELAFEFNDLPLP